MKLSYYLVIIRTYLLQQFFTILAINSCVNVITIAITLGLLLQCTLHTPQIPYLGEREPHNGTKYKELYATLHLWLVNNVQWRIHLIVLYTNVYVYVLYTNSRKNRGGIINCVLHTPCQVNYKKT